MTPGARVATAIDLLDRIFAGAAAEQVLTSWARGSRFAGSKDRAALRDHVYDALRQLRVAQALGGGTGGRAVMLGLLRVQGIDPATLFHGQGYAPAPLTKAEIAGGRVPDANDAMNLPDWLCDRFRAGLGDAALEMAQALSHRAPVFVRVNLLKTQRDAAILALAAEGIVAQPHPASTTALELTENARRIGSSRAYHDGLVELQDAASQAVVDALPLQPGQSVLDYCAGGGGKALAMAARLGGPGVVAQDADPGRMRDLPLRAERAGAQIAVRAHATSGEIYDLVLCDAPCSGSGAWRRAPEGKWRLMPERLADLAATQSGILDAAASQVSRNGVLAYATCSVLREENADQMQGFVQRNPDWRCSGERFFLPQNGADGFYLCQFRRLGDSLSARV